MDWEVVDASVPDIVGRKDRASSLDWYRLEDFGSCQECRHLIPEDRIERAKTVGGATGGDPGLGKTVDVGLEGR